MHASIMSPVMTLLAWFASVASVTSQGDAWQTAHSTWMQVPPGSSRVFSEGRRLSRQPPVDAQRVLLPASEDTRRPRRGRIVARIHASSLSIPALHSRYTSGAASAPLSPDMTSQSECNDLCPPSWMAFVNNLRGKSGNVTEPVCTFSDVFSSCSAPNEICRTEPVKFRCCPSHCVPSAMSCYTGQPTPYLCVPKTIQPWMRKMLKLLG